MQEFGPDAVPRLEFPQSNQRNEAKLIDPNDIRKVEVFEILRRRGYSERPHLGLTGGSGTLVGLFRCSPVALG